jgi:hypothetical protein
MSFLSITMFSMSVFALEIKVLLSKVKRSFMFFEMMSRSKSKFVPTLIYKKSNDILVNMNRVTQKYVALATT